MSTGAYVQAALLAVLAWTLTITVPDRLAAASWPARAPRAALAAWAATGLGAGLSTAGSLLGLGLAPLGGHLPGSLAVLAGDLADGHDPLPPAAWIPLAAGLALLTWQLLVLTRCLLAVAARRRAHRDLLDVIGTWEESLGSVVLEDPRMLAYHLPGLRDTRVVVTRGCVELTRDDELRAVLAHERAHARGRHHVLLEPFIAWERTFTALPRVSTSARRATAAVALLTEMLADDAAARQTGSAVMLAALRRVGCGRAGAFGDAPADARRDPADWAPDPATLARARRLLRR